MTVSVSLFLEESFLLVKKFLKEHNEKCELVLGSATASLFNGKKRSDGLYEYNCLLTCRHCVYIPQINWNRQNMYCTTVLPRLFRKYNFEEWLKSRKAQVKIH